MRTANIFVFRTLSPSRRHYKQPLWRSRSHFYSVIFRNLKEHRAGLIFKGDNSNPAFRFFYIPRVKYHKKIMFTIH